MTIHLCRTCGTSFPDADEPPASCPICEDERQWVPASGQAWTTAAELASGHANLWRTHEPGVMELRTVPGFAIGQRAFLVRTPAGNVLWDCLALLDAATEEIVRSLGGLVAIAISHPHFYTRMQDWAQAFDVPVHLHADDREWVVRDDPRLAFWDGDGLALADGLTLLRLGGHFAGGTVLHWSGDAPGTGVLFGGDIVQVAADARRVSFLWSYPNMLPLPASAVTRIAARLAPWRFDRLYGAFPGKEVTGDAAGVVARSAARYVELLEGSDTPLPATCVGGDA